MSSRIVLVHHAGVIVDLYGVEGLAGLEGDIEDYTPGRVLVELTQLVDS